jgi:hypothetical protein
LNGSDPKQALIDYMSASRMLVSTWPTSGGWRGEMSAGGLGASLQTIRILKERAVHGRRVYAVTGEDDRGLRMLWACQVTQDESGAWHFSGGAGGGDDFGPDREHPCANLGGGGWPGDFYAGGRVLAGGQDVARVRLRSANGIELEDTVDEGVVLFVTDQYITLPLQAELYDRAGALVWQHPVFDLGRSTAP